MFPWVICGEVGLVGVLGVHRFGTAVGQVVLDHGFMTGYHELDPEMELPVVPIVLNCTVPPLMTLRQTVNSVSRSVRRFAPLTGWSGWDLLAPAVCPVVRSHCRVDQRNGRDQLPGLNRRAAHQWYSPVCVGCPHFAEHPIPRHSNDFTSLVSPNGYLGGMAHITRTYQVDDLDGSEDDVTTVFFSLDGSNFEIDLSAANEARLREGLARFVDAAGAVKPARAGRSPRRAKAVSPPPNRDQAQAIRDWARNNGFEVSARGRISKAIQDAFDAAH